MFQVQGMDVERAVQKVDRDSDLGDDSPMSNDEDEIRDDGGASSDEGVNVKPMANSNSSPSLPIALDFGSKPKSHSELLNQLPHFGHNNPLGVLENLSALNMNVKNLSNLHNGDVLDKLKLQVRDMKMNSMEHHHHDFPLHSIFSNVGGNHHHTQQNYSSNGTATNASNQHQLSKGKDIGHGSSAVSSNTSESNGWSFEEQFKQVRQLYEINDDPKRKPFLDDLFAFMASKGQPINRLPIMAKSVLDLYELYKLVVARGGLVEVIQKKLWQEIIKGLHLPSSITSAAFTLRTQYMKYLFDYECSKYGFSTRSELDAAIEGNKREGRRSSYGQFEQQFSKQNPLTQGMTPLSLMSHNASPGQHPLAGAGGNAQTPNLEQLAGLFNADIGETMMNYLKMIQARERPQSPEAMTPQDAINLQMEMSRVALWSMYANNTSPPHSTNNTSPQEAQREPHDLRRSPSPAHMSRKRDFEDDKDGDDDEVEGESNGKDYTMPPPIKKTHLESPRVQTPVKNIKEERLDPDERPRPKDVEKTISGGITGMQFKFVNDGEPQLVVSMEVNGVQFEGVLFSNKSQRAMV